jgi:hypothetical protein
MCPQGRMPGDVTDTLLTMRGDISSGVKTVSLWQESPQECCIEEAAVVIQILRSYHYSIQHLISSNGFKVCIYYKTIQSHFLD